MSASAMYHGPFTASARLIEPGEFTKEAFISLDVRTPGASVTFVSIDADGLDALAEAIVAARALLPVPVSVS